MSRLGNDHLSNVSTLSENIQGDFLGVAALAFQKQKLEGKNLIEAYVIYGDSILHDIIILFYFILFLLAERRKILAWFVGFTTR